MLRTLTSDAMLESTDAQGIVGLTCEFAGVPVPCVRVKRLLPLKDGRITLGLYLKKKNTIVLNRRIGMTMETLMHELGHHFTCIGVNTAMTHGAAFLSAEELVWKTHTEAVKWWNEEVRKEK